MNDNQEHNSIAESTRFAKADGNAQRRNPDAAPLGEVLAAGVVLKMVRSLARGFLRMFFTKTSSSNSFPIISKENRRSEDRVVEPINARDQRWGSVLVTALFLLALAAGVGFLIIYWTTASDWMLGGVVAIFLGGLGASFVIYSHRLMTKHQAIEPREEASSTSSEQDRAMEDFCAGAHDIQRRGLLVSIGIGAAGFAAAMVVSLFRSMGASPMPSLFDTVWKRGQRLTKPDGTHVTLDALQPGSTIIVYPEDSVGNVKAQTLLIRVDAQRLQLPAGRQDWAPMGYVAYSRVCTHAGCPVGMFETSTDLLMCPCHQSTFNVLKGAQPTGGPAARPLPQLPLYAGSDGILRAGGAFNEPPGPGFWQLQ